MGVELAKVGLRDVDKRHGAELVGVKLRLRDGQGVSLELDVAADNLGLARMQIEDDISAQFAEDRHAQILLKDGRFRQFNLVDIDLQRARFARLGEISANISAAQIDQKIGGRREVQQTQDRRKSGGHPRDADEERLLFGHAARCRSTLCPGVLRTLGGRCAHIGVGDALGNLDIFKLHAAKPPEVEVLDAHVILATELFFDLNGRDLFEALVGKGQDQRDHKDRETKCDIDGDANDGALHNLALLLLFDISRDFDAGADFAGHARVAAQVDALDHHRLSACFDDFEKFQKVVNLSGADVYADLIFKEHRLGFVRRRASQRNLFGIIAIGADAGFGGARGHKTGELDRVVGKNLFGEERREVVLVGGRLVLEIDRPRHRQEVQRVLILVGLVFDASQRAAEESADHDHHQDRHDDGHRDEHLLLAWAQGFEFIAQGFFGHQEHSLETCRWNSTSESLLILSSPSWRTLWMQSMARKLSINCSTDCGLVVSP